MQAALVMTVTSWISPLESRVKSNTNCGRALMAVSFSASLLSLTRHSELLEMLQ